MAQVIQVVSGSPDSLNDAVQQASDVLHRGGLVIFPTETVYGLAADALSEEAVRRVWEVKGRPSDKPLPVQVADVDGLRLLWREVPEDLVALIRALMPGPLTLVYWRRYRRGADTRPSGGAGAVTGFWQTHCRAECQSVG